jgi:hypothetical protein
VSRQIIQLHTINQWFAMDQQVRTMLLKALRIRDRLWQFRLKLEQDKVLLKDSKWVPCTKCNQTGWCWKHPRKAGVHPSAISTTPCLLKVYWEAIGVEASVMHEARALLLFDLGTAAHDMLQRFGLSGAWGEYYKPEIPIEETELAQDLMMVGHADADNIIAIDDIPGAPIFEVGVIHEYKTINDKGFEGLKGKPKSQHLAQATIYSACLNRPVVVYLYLNKNNSNMEDFPIEFNPQVWNAIYERAQVVKQHLIEQTEPKAEVGYHCGQCAYMYGCAAYKASKSKKGQP